MIKLGGLYAYEHTEATKLALFKTQTYAEQIPDVVCNDLYAYIVKYVY